MEDRFNVVATGLKFPEGPVWLPDGSVLVVEMAISTLTRVSPDGRRHVIAQLEGTPNGAALGPDGKCYIANNGGLAWHEDPGGGIRGAGEHPDYKIGWIERVDIDTGKVERLHTHTDGGPIIGPNDLVFDRQGGLWFTDFGKPRKDEITRGSLCYIPPDMSRALRVVYPMLTPNGIGLSADERRLYVAESLTSRIWRFELSAPGRIDPVPFPKSPNGGILLATLDGYRLCDSLAIDEDENICVATFFNSSIATVSKDGRSTDYLPTPDLFTTNIAFGGPDRRTACVTYAYTGQLVSCRWPRPGLPLNFSKV